MAEKQNNEQKEVKVEQPVEQTTDTSAKMTEQEKQLRQKYQDKFIKDTKKDKRMGATFWILLGLCVAAIAFTVTIIIVRS